MDDIKNYALNEKLDEIIQNNTELVKKLGENAVTTLMGIAMKASSGDKVSGHIYS